MRVLVRRVALVVRDPFRLVLRQRIARSVRFGQGEKDFGRSVPLYGEQEIRRTWNSRIALM